jgi:phosphoribosylformylglycinamidine (FGAM) synthase PurS component
MSVWQVVVTVKSRVTDHHGEALKKECVHSGLKGVKSVRVGPAYELSGNLPETEVRRLAERLLADPVTQEASIAVPGAVKAPAGARLVRIWLKNGVADPVGDTVLFAAKDVGVRGLDSARSGRAYEFHGPAGADALRRFCEEHLMNPLIQRVEIL